MPVEQLNVEILSRTTDLVGAAVHGSTVTTLHDRHHATNRRSSAGPSTPSWGGQRHFSYKNGVVSVGTTATLIATPSSAPDVDGILIQNLGAVTLYLGGSTVTAGTTSTGGYQVAASASVLVPTTGASAEGLYGIVASSTANVSFLYPG
jgi:uncharacterized membrane protein